MSGSDSLKNPAVAWADDELWGEARPSEEDQRRLALQLILDAWDDALGEGVEPDIVASTAIFSALSDMIESYGEEAVVKLVDGLADRIRQGEFTLYRTMQ